jgi:hypothetical protein
MKARVKGEVFKSKQRPGKKYFTTAITQDEEEMQTTLVSTVKQYKPGDKIDLEVKVNVSLFNGKAYMVVTEVDDTASSFATEEKAVKAGKI